MDIKLLNDGGYNGLLNLNFPIKTEATEYVYPGERPTYRVHIAHLEKLGVDITPYKPLGYLVFSEDEVEVL